MDPDSQLVGAGVLNRRAAPCAFHSQRPPPPARLPRGPFGAFSVVDVPGFRAPFARALNVYFAAVTSNPADPDNSLVALFPLRDEGLAILGLGVSCDGKRFSRLAVLATRAVAAHP